MNQALLTGRLGSDAEVKQTKNNVLTTFQLATNDSYRTKDGEYKEKTQWHTIVLWGNKVGEILKKGQEVEVVGSINNSSYEKIVGGEKVTMKTSEIEAKSVKLTGAYLGPKRSVEINNAESSGPVEDQNQN